MNERKTSVIAGNKRRVALLRKKHLGAGITSAEENELKSLQSDTEKVLRKARKSVFDFKKLADCEKALGAKQ